MQLAPLHSSRALSPMPATVVRPGEPWPLPPLAGAAVARTASAMATVPVPPTAPTVPLIDFPGIQAGDVFDIAKGSKVGFLTPTGTAGITRLEPQAATFRIKASAFGQRADLIVTVERIDAERVCIMQQAAGSVAPTFAEGRIVATRRNYAEFVSIDGKNTRTVIQHDGAGQIVIDTVVPTMGNAHLVLRRR